MTLPPSHRSKRVNAILAVIGREGHITEYYARAGRCSVAEATVELMRLEQQGVVERGKGGYGMTWRATRRMAH